MQTVSLRIFTQFVVSISYNNNHYIANALNKWSMHKPESVLENKIHKIFLATNRSHRKPDLVSINKKKQVDFIN